MILDRKEISPFGTNEEGHRGKARGDRILPCRCPEVLAYGESEERTIKL